MLPGPTLAAQSPIAQLRGEIGCVERLGHSLSVLYDTYAHVINKDLDRDNELAEAAFS